MIDNIANDTSVTGPRKIVDRLSSEVASHGLNPFSTVFAIDDDSPIIAISFRDQMAAQQCLGATVEITLKPEPESERSKTHSYCFTDLEKSLMRANYKLLDYITALEKKIGEK